MDKSMKIVQAIAALRDQTRRWREAGLRVGFVPTMGNLHAGHLSLVEQARRQCDRVVVSIYVNPMQFNQSSDFEAYPRTLQADQEKLEAADVDLLFLPDNDMMYPEGQESITRVQVPGVTDDLEGACRPGHFDGVATIVMKLFNLVQPDIAVFGEKDYQQLLLVQKMVDDLNLPVKIQSALTAREPDGLAMSSRNNRLEAQQRQQAAEIYRILLQARQQLHEGHLAIADIEHQAMQALREAGFEPEYVSFRQAGNFRPLQSVYEQGRLLVAAWLGEVRLIDNISTE